VRAKATKVEQQELAMRAAELEREGHYTLAYRNWSRVEGRWAEHRARFCSSMFAAMED
jgi:hypothetical protein